MGEEKFQLQSSKEFNDYIARTKEDPNLKNDISSTKTTWELRLAIIAIFITALSTLFGAWSAWETSSQAGIAADSLRQQREAEALDEYILAVQNICSTAMQEQALDKNFAFSPVYKIGAAVYFPDNIAAITQAQYADIIKNLEVEREGIQKAYFKVMRYIRGLDREVLVAYNKYFSEIRLINNEKIKFMRLVALKSGVICKINLMEMLSWYTGDKIDPPVFVGDQNVKYVPLVLNDPEFDFENEYYRIGAPQDLKFSGYLSKIYLDSTRSIDYSTPVSDNVPLYSGSPGVNLKPAGRVIRREH